MSIEIPLKISKNELLIRGVLHPIFYSNSKNKLKREAFLPPPNKEDVSILRHKYTDDHFCKSHSKALKIGESNYCGIATFINNHINILNDDLSLSIKANTKASPIDENNNYRIDNPIYKTDSGLPMHADLIYAEKLIKGEPNTKHREYAEKLSKIAYFIKDEDVENNKWTNEGICWKDGSNTQ